MNETDVALELQVVDSLELQGYTVQGQIAKGKFGVVLAAHSVIRRKDVALKVLEKELQPNGSPDLHRSPAAVSNSSQSIPYDLPNEVGWTDQPLA